MKIDDIEVNYKISANPTVPTQRLEIYGKYGVRLDPPSGSGYSTLESQAYAGNENALSWGHNTYSYGTLLGDGSICSKSNVFQLKEAADHTTPSSMGVIGAGYGRVWLKDGTPNTLWFTDDADTDHQLGAGGGGGLNQYGAGTFNDTAAGSNVGGNADANAYITSDTYGCGALAHGFANAYSGTNKACIISCGKGSVATGYAKADSSYSAVIKSTAYGSFAMGGVVNGGCINATGIGSFAGGHVTYGNIVTASANGSFQWGGGTNATGCSLQVGYGTNIRCNASIFIKEKAAADGDVTAWGQFWVRNDAPNTPMFTTDTGVDIDLSASGGISDVVDDTTPQLGGHLDLNTNSICVVAGQNLKLCGQPGQHIMQYVNGNTIVGTNSVGIAIQGNYDIYNATANHVQICAAGVGRHLRMQSYGAGTNLAWEAVDSSEVVGANMDSDGNLTICQGNIKILEQSDHKLGAGAGHGQFWVRNDTPNVPMFTDDDGVDHVLNAGGGGLTCTGAGTFAATGGGSNVGGISYTYSEIIATTYGCGAFVHGFAYSGAAGYTGKLCATSNGSVALGAACGYNGYKSYIMSSGPGAMAVGYAYYGGYIKASGDGSFAGGCVVGYANHAMATGDGSFQWGCGTNSTGGSLQVGAGTNLRPDGSVFLQEKLSAASDVASWGQLWVKNDTPNVLYFTDDAGTDHDLLAGGGGSGATEANTTGTSVQLKDAYTDLDPNAMGAYSIDFQTHRSAATNTACGANSAIVGGKDNLINALAPDNSIFGAYLGQILGCTYSGYTQCIDFSQLVGGNQNRIYTQAGPTSNTVFHGNAILGGAYNRLCATNYAVILGGTSNQVDGSDFDCAAVTHRVVVNNGGIRIKEQANHDWGYSATWGEIWLKSSSPNCLMFTDDDGDDHVLNSGGGGLTQFGGGTFNATGSGSNLGGGTANAHSILCANYQGDGAFIHGYANGYSSGNKSSLCATARGTFVSGYVLTQPGYIAKIHAAAPGAMAVGRQVCSTTCAAGYGSFAGGDADGNAIIATASGSFQWGPGTNATACSVQVGANTSIRSTGSIFLKEKGSADSDTPAWGQLWVKNTVPAELWFTDDAGTDTKIV